MGPSGSGKSTLMNILGCLDRPDRGRLPARRRGRRRARPRRAGARCATAASASSSRASTCSPRDHALENVELPLLYCRACRRRERGAGARAALEVVGLAERVDHQPDAALGRPAAARRDRPRAGRRPGLILADEPTGNLDSRTSVEIMALFQELNARGITIVLVTHEPDIAAHARRIVRSGTAARRRRAGTSVGARPVASARAARPREAAA